MIESPFRSMSQNLVQATDRSADKGRVYTLHINLEFLAGPGIKARMARPTRIDFPGAWYHVFNRGIEKRFIFRSTRCYERFLELLATLPGRFGVRLTATR